MHLWLQQEWIERCRIESEVLVLRSREILHRRYFDPIRGPWMPLRWPPVVEAASSSQARAIEGEDRLVAPHPPSATGCSEVGGAELTGS